jgi:hypothetical protein
MGWRFHIDLSAPLSNYSPHLDSPSICGVTDDHIAFRVDGQTVHSTSYFGASLEASDCAWTVLEKDTQGPSSEEQHYSQRARTGRRYGFHHVPLLKESRPSTPRSDYGRVAVQSSRRLVP